MEVRASVSGIRVSPRKARLVLDAIRGKRVADAIAIARFLPQKTAHDVGKLLRSVSANAENNYALDMGELRIKRAFAGEGRTLKRFKAKARGRVAPILHRTSHVTVIVEEEQ